MWTVVCRHPDDVTSSLTSLEFLFMSFMREVSLSSSVWCTSRYSLTERENDKDFRMMQEQWPYTKSSSQPFWAAVIHALNMTVVRAEMWIRGNIWAALTPGLVWGLRKLLPLFWAAALVSCCCWTCARTDGASWALRWASSALLSSPWRSYTWKHTNRCEWILRKLSLPPQNQLAIRNSNLFKKNKVLF